MDATTSVKAKYEALSGRLNEATLRLWAAVEARSLGRGGVTTVAEASGLSRTTIYAGLRELEVAPGKPASGGGRIRAAGGGRKRLPDKDPTLLCDLDALVEPSTRGDPQSPLRWTCKSTPRLAKELQSKGHKVSQRGICDLNRSFPRSCEGLLAAASERTRTTSPGRWRLLAAPSARRDAVGAARLHRRHRR